MRIILHFKAAADQSYHSCDYNKIRGFVNKLFLNSGMIGIHDKEGYKPYSFSNIFPYGDMKEGEQKKFILASPSDMIIDRILNHLPEMMGKVVNIGNNSYVLEDFKAVKKIDLSAPLYLTSSTPIIIRIPERNYNLYNVPEGDRKTRYIYWRPHIAFDSFIKQLSENIIKKYNDFYGTSVQYPNLFEQFIFKKPVYTRLITDRGKSYGVAASLWDFRWNNLEPIQKKLLSFGIDAGFGERNGWGFGFINP